MSKSLKTVSQVQKFIKATIKNGITDNASFTGYVGLSLRVRPNKNKQSANVEFRHRYTHPITRVRKVQTLGKYPAMSLEQARKAHTENLKLLSQNIDPIEHGEKQRQKELLDRKNSMQKFIDLWKAEQKNKIKQGAMKQTSYQDYLVKIKLIEKHLGHLKVTDVSAGVVIDFIRDMQKLKTNAFGLDTKKLLSAIMNIALAERVIDYNPTYGVNNALGKHKQTPKPALTKPAEFAELLKEIDQLPKDNRKQFFEKKILQLLALTFVRIDDLCSAKWADIDLKGGYWAIEQMKAGERDDMAKQLVIPLAKQTITILEELQPITGDQEYVFFNARRKKSRYHDRHQINKLLNSEDMNPQKLGGQSYQAGRGYMGVHCPHGFRSCAKSMLRDLGYDEEATELQLGHKVLNAYGKSYSRMHLINERTQMMHRWADYLDEIKAGKHNQILHYDFKKSQTLAKEA